MPLMDQDSKRETTLKLKDIKEENQIKQNKVAKLEEKLNSLDNLQKIQTGNTQGMTKEQINKSTRDAAIDLNMRTDLHQELITNIGKNLYDARDNLNTVSVEVNKQDEQIDRIHENVGETQNVVGRTDKRITGMNRRVFCHKFLLNLLALILFSAIITVLIIKLTRK